MATANTLDYHLISNKAISRTAPSTQGLLIRNYFDLSEELCRLEHKEQALILYTLSHFFVSNGKKYIISAPRERPVDQCWEAQAGLPCAGRSVGCRLPSSEEYAVVRSGLMTKQVLLVKRVSCYSIFV